MTADPQARIDAAANRLHGPGSLSEHTASLALTYLLTRLKVAAGDLDPESADRLANIIEKSLEHGAAHECGLTR